MSEINPIAYKSSAARFKMAKGLHGDSLTISSVIFLFFMVLVGAAIRIDYLVASSFVIDSDEAIVGLMAKHIAEGATVPVFYYGQHYMGSFEPFILSIFFKVFGFQPWLIKVVPLIFSLLFIVVMFAIGFAIRGNRTAQIASALTAIAPSTLVLWSSKARGGFIELVLIGAFLTLFTLWWLEADKFNWRRLFGISFIFGFGWWTNNQIVYFFPALGLAVTYKVFNHAKTVFSGLVDYIKAIAWCFVASILGGLPFWIYNAQNEFASFSQLLREHETEITEHIAGFFEFALPILLGAKRYWQTADLFPSATFSSYVLYGLLFIVAAIVTFGFRESKKAPYLFFLCILFSTITIFVTSPYGYLSMAPRYLLPLYVPIIGLATIGIDGIYSNSNSSGRLILGLLLVFNIASTYLNERAIPGEPFVQDGERVSRDHSDLYRWLDENSIPWVRTNYWIGYRIAYETAEEVRFVVFQKPLQRRIPEYEEEAKEYGIGRIPFVLVPSQARIVKRSLSLLGYSFSAVPLSGYVVIYDLKAPELNGVPVSAETFTPSSNFNSERIAGAFDGDLNTRWGSASPQNPDMEIRITFNNPTTISAIGYELAEWRHDFPRELTVIGTKSDGEEVRLITRKQYQALRYTEAGGEWRAQFAPEELTAIRIKQLGEHPILDWSVAELELFTPQ